MTTKVRASTLDEASVVNFVLPPGTRLGFQQTSAPTGWTKDTTAGLNDSVMRIVTGSVGSGGSVAFSTFAGQTSTSAYTLTTADIPSHSHSASSSVTDPGHLHPWSSYTVNAAGGNYATGMFTHISSWGNSVSRPTGSTTTGITVSTSIGSAGGGGGHSHGVSQNIKYFDFIIATKN